MSDEAQVLAHNTKSITQNPQTVSPRLIRLGADCVDASCDFPMELGIAIRRSGTGKRIRTGTFRVTAGSPRRWSDSGDIAMQNTPAVVRNDEEAVQHAKRE